jgi:hypothetical protein
VVAAAGSRSIEHLGFAHDDAQLEALKAAAAERLAERQQCWIWLWDALCRAYQARGFDHVLDGDEVLLDLVRGSSSRPASSTRCGCSPRPELSQPPPYG